jgi:two-component system sensor histidine kinase BarA
MHPSTECDADVLLRLEELGGKPFVSRMIDVFVSSARKQLASAWQSERDGDHLAISRAAHSLKSSARNLGAVRVAELADQIEDRAADGMDAVLSQLLTDLEAAFARAEAFLAQQR